VQIRLTIFLLIYWGLLVNLGPSLHTHSVFGLHGDSSSAAEIYQSEAEQSCSCCSSDFASDEPSELPAEDEIQSLCDCSLCEFFDYLNVTPVIPQQWVPQQSVEFSYSKLDGFLSTDQVCSRARGPPHPVSWI